jgi:hypothetical protein
MHPDFFAKRTLVLKETYNNTKHLDKNKNYDKILNMLLVFNLDAATPWAGLTLLAMDGKSPNGSRRSHSSRRQRGIEVTIDKAP